MSKSSNAGSRQRVVVFQGGGAQGFYQAGAYEALEANGLSPSWVTGISIAAVNAAIIAGNKPEDRVPNLMQFWRDVTIGFPDVLPVKSGVISLWWNEGTVTAVACWYIPGFFMPRLVPARELHWDGGLVSNTPLKYVLDAAPLRDLLIFQVDLFSARRSLPQTLADTLDREKDIGYASRRRMNTDRAIETHRLKAALRMVLQRHLRELGDDTDVALLRALAEEGSFNIVHRFSLPAVQC